MILVLQLLVIYGKDLTEEREERCRCHHWYLPFSCTVSVIQAADLVYGRPGCEGHIRQRGSLSMSERSGLVRDLDLKTTVKNKQWLTKPMNTIKYIYLHRSPATFIDKSITFCQFSIYYMPCFKIIHPLGIFSKWLNLSSWGQRSSNVLQAIWIRYSYLIHKDHIQ